VERTLDHHSMEMNLNNSQIILDLNTEKYHLLDIVEDDSLMRKRDELKKLNMKRYADNKQ
jgi:hypothetical protein